MNNKLKNLAVYKLVFTLVIAFGLLACSKDSSKGVEAGIPEDTTGIALGGEAAASDSSGTTPDTAEGESGGTTSDVPQQICGKAYRFRLTSLLKNDEDGKIVFIMNDGHSYGLYSEDPGIEAQLQTIGYGKKYSICIIPGDTSQGFHATLLNVLRILSLSQDR